MSKGKIIVVGGNQTGLAFACFAQENGFEVTVFEKKKRKDVSYEWFDDMNESTFEKIGLECPPIINSMRTPGVTMISPERRNFLTISDEDNASDVPIRRRELNELIYQRAKKAGVNFKFDTAVKRVIVQGDTIVGIELSNGKTVLSDLVVDCAGCESNIRGSLPGSFKIPQKVNPGDTFFVRRVYFKRPKQAMNIEAHRKIYLKHLNERGISWCFPSHDGKYADVLIGRLGELSDEVFEKALADVKAENEIIGDEIAFGGELCKIPVRHAISRMVANGYALLGDSAYMTIPMMGSGMANSLRGAKYLSDVISAPQGNAFSIENLYGYQLAYMKNIGAEDSSVEIIKNWLLNSGDGEVDFLMEKGIINSQVLGGISGTPDASMILNMAKSIFSGLSKPALLLQLLKTVINMGRQKKIALSMPEKYDEVSFTNWQREYEKLF